jgi:hypothetical protein
MSERQSYQDCGQNKPKIQNAVLNMEQYYSLEKFSSGMHYIIVDADTVNSLASGGSKRAICWLNDQARFHCALMPKAEGGHFINIGSKICKQLDIREGSTVRARFEPDTSVYQFEMPEELKEVLATDPDAYIIFHGLTEGNQRGLIYLVSQVKSSDKRIERAIKIAERIKNGITSPRIILK